MVAHRNSGDESHSDMDRFSSVHSNRVPIKSPYDPRLIFNRSNERSNEDLNDSSSHYNFRDGNFAATE